jgi:hypothetical protein
MKKYTPVLALALGGIFLLGSCTDFFSSSLGTWAVRDRSKTIPVNPGDVNELVTKVENDPDMSLGVLKGINDAVKNASGADKITLQRAALEAAANAAGLSNSILNRAGELTSADNPEKAKDMMVDAINDMQNLSETSTLLGSVLPDPDADPAGFQAFVDAADPNDLAVAAAVLLAAEGKKHLNESGEAMSDYVDNFDPSGAGLSPSEKLAVTLAEEAAKKPGDLNDSMKNLLDGMNLTLSAPGP